MDMGDGRLEPLVLSDAERRTLQGWAVRRKTAQGLALRARIVLACAEGGSNTAVSALERTAPVLPMLPGVPERRSFDYVRHGTVDLFAALNTATGKVIGHLSAQHRAIDFRDFLDEIDRQTEPAWPSTSSATISPFRGPSGLLVR